MAAAALLLLIGMWVHRVDQPADKVRVIHPLRNAASEGATLDSRIEIRAANHHTHASDRNVRRPYCRDFRIQMWIDGAVVDQRS